MIIYCTFSFGCPVSFVFLETGFPKYRPGNRSAVFAGFAAVPFSALFTAPFQKVKSAEFDPGPGFPGGVSECFFPPARTVEILRGRNGETGGQRRESPVFRQ
jgi:hypothetical protein